MSVLAQHLNDYAHQISRKVACEIAEQNIMVRSVEGDYEVYTPTRKELHEKVNKIVDADGGKYTAQEREYFCKVVECYNTFSMSIGNSIYNISFEG